MRRPNSERLKRNPSAGAFSNGRIDGASMYAQGPYLESFFLEIPFYLQSAALGLVVYSASNGNEYQKHKNNNVSGE
jgi:hypothetical protein